MSFTATARSPYSFAPPYRFSSRTGVARRSGMGDQATVTAATILSAAAPIPVAGPFLAAAGQLVGLFGSIFSGCGATCTQATAYANQAGAQLNTLMQQYFAIPPPRPYAVQQTYLNDVNQIISWLQQMCGNPSLGQAGQRCILERLQRRACPSTLNDSNIGGAQINFCDYYSTFYDPVANDPNVAPPASTPAASPSSTSGTTSTAGGLNLSSLLLPGLLILGGIIFVTSE